MNRVKRFLNRVITPLCVRAFDPDNDQTEVGML